MIEYDINEIRKVLAHRYPFLLVDRVLSFDAESKVLEAIKNVTINEPFFQGHFPTQPVMPGVLIVEALAQSCCMSIYASNLLSVTNGLTYLTGVDQCRFKRIVVPGDQLNMKVQLVKQRGSVCKFSGQAFVGDELACSCEIMASFVTGTG